MKKLMFTVLLSFSIMNFSIEGPTSGLSGLRLVGFRSILKTIAQSKPGQQIADLAKGTLITVVPLAPVILAVALICIDPHGRSLN